MNLKQIFCRHKFIWDKDLRERKDDFTIRDDLFICKKCGKSTRVTFVVNTNPPYQSGQTD